MISNSTVSIAGAQVKLSLIDGRFDFEVLTPSGQPSELSAFGLPIEDAAHFVLELPKLLAACPSAASTPMADNNVVGTLLASGVRNARAAALAGRQLIQKKPTLGDTHV